MQLSYDPKRNIAYLRLRDADGAEIESLRLSDEIVVDLSSDGAVYGIELLNANEQLAGGRFVLDWGTKRLEVSLPEAV
jgi:uncharacterized protein YuzE